MHNNRDYAKYDTVVTLGIHKKEISIENEKRCKVDNVIVFLFCFINLLSH